MANADARKVEDALKEIHAVIKKLAEGMDKLDHRIRAIEKDQNNPLP